LQACSWGRLADILCLESMQLSDVLAIVFVVAAAAAFLVGEGALVRAEDIRAIYWLAVGVVSLQAAVQIAKPGGKG
jgi:hypothetical protein